MTTRTKPRPLFHLPIYLPSTFSRNTNSLIIVSMIMHSANQIYNKQPGVVCCRSEDRNLDHVKSKWTMINSGWVSIDFAWLDRSELVVKNNHRWFAALGRTWHFLAALIHLIWQIQANSLFQHITPKYALFSKHYVNMSSGFDFDLRSNNGDWLWLLSKIKSEKSERPMTFAVTSSHQLPLSAARQIWSCDELALSAF